jgi:Capsule assembly protein Wzi
LKTILTIYLAFSTFFIVAQSSKIKREIKYSAEAGTVLSTNGETPFWLRSNQYGTMPFTSPTVLIGGSVSSDYKKAITKEDQYKLSKFDWGYGLNIVGNLTKESQILIPEVYVKAKFGAFEFYAGRRKELVGLVDSILSSGSYIWSGNALPMPKIQISNPEFVPLGFTDGFLSFKGSYAHGWFENSRSDVKSFYLHQKTLYLRFGKPNWKFHFYGGFNHQAQWGGTLLYKDPNNIGGIGGVVGSGIEDYYNVVTGRSLAVKGDTSKTGANDAQNRSGNHLGTLDVGFDFQVNHTKIMVYRQSIFEDGSLAYLNNISDGLHGLSIKFLDSETQSFSIKRINFEYLNTTSQGGPIGSLTDVARLRGEDNYLNNGVYKNGWTYFNKPIGTPFIDKFGESRDTRVEVYHFGLESTLLSKPLLIRVAQSSSYGTYTKPNLRKELFVSAQMVFNLKNNFTLKTNISFDSGTLENDKFGVGINLKKVFN